MSVTSDQNAHDTSSSLLSRITPTTANGARDPLILEATRAPKRSAPEGEATRPNKRRALVNGIQEEAQYVLEDSFTPWLDGHDPCDVDASREDRLHYEFAKFVGYISPSEKEREARRVLVEHIETLLRTRWRDANVTLFGSSATGLELSGGDIDLVVAFDPGYKLSEPEKKRRLAAMGDVLRRSGVTTWVNRIFGATVPIITFTTSEALGDVSVDISIRNDEDSGPRAIPIIKQYLQEMPALRPLIQAVKAFLSLRELNDASQGTLSSYAITILCISFLQRNPARRPQTLLDKPLENKALGILLMDFFRHYGHDFSYATHYVSVTDKGIFTKKSKNWEEKGNAVLAVQCLLNPDKNITRGCGKIHVIVEAFKQAHHALQNMPLPVSKNASTSLLTQVYEVPKKMDAKRRVLEACVESGAFTKAVAACTTVGGTRYVSGGVSLANRIGSRNREPPLRLGPGPVKFWNTLAQGQNGQGRPVGVQQLPVLRWRDSQLQSSSQFQFQFQHQGYNSPMNTVLQMQADQNYAQQQFAYASGLGYGHNNHYEPSYRGNTGRYARDGRY